MLKLLVLAWCEGDVLVNFASLHCFFWVGFSIYTFRFVFFGSYVLVSKCL